MEKSSAKDIENLIIAVNEINNNSGLQCQTTSCVFNECPVCLIKNVYIIEGKCPHYNPALTLKDVSPGYVNEGSQE